MNLGFLSALNREQKIAFGLLQFGTFLEYFDLYLYIHLSVLLNDLFFPPTDPQAVPLLSAFAFCSIFIARPFTALILGYIGDTIGRKSTVIITTMMMSLSCMVMANLPTHAQIGILASWFMIMCRVLQGFSSMGELIGAKIYLTEMIKPPLRYPVVASLTVTVGLGSMVALLVANLVTTQGFDWRIAFWIGAVVAIIGSTARTYLRETPDFVDMKCRLTKAIKDAEESGLEKVAQLLKKTNPIFKEKVHAKTIWAYFSLECTGPLGLFIAYIYMGNVLKTSFGFSAHQVIQQNLIVMIVTLSRYILLTHLSAKIHPLKLIKIQLYIFIPFILIYPYFLINHLTVMTILLFQILSECFIPITHPATALIFPYFPIFKRFTCVSFIFATTRAVMHVTTSFGTIYITSLMGHGGLLIVILPTIAAFAWGLRYFEKLEQQNIKNYQLSQNLEALQPLKTGT